MVTPTVRAVVLVSFPFSDLSQSKLRPVVVLADVGRDDWILCQITSNPYGEEQAIIIKEENFETGSLRVVSYMRPGKLFTANSSIIKSQVGLLKEDIFRIMIDVVTKILQSSYPPKATEESEKESIEK